MVWLRRTGRFCWRVVTRFRQNKGLLLASGVGYNALLSFIPLVAVALIVVSRVVDHQHLLSLAHTQLEVLLPGSGIAVAGALSFFLESGSLAGGIGVLALLFFGAMAFRVLEDAIAIIFQRRRRREQRHPVISFLISLAYVGAVVTALLTMTLVTVALEAMPGHTYALLGVDLAADMVNLVLLRAIALLGMIALVTSFYRVLPVAQVQLRHALVGGTIAALLLEVVRNLLVWYFAHISLVGVIYGSFATVVVALLSFEVGAIILLLCAQLIAEIDRARDADLHWWEEPPMSVYVGTARREELLADGETWDSDGDA